MMIKDRQKISNSSHYARSGGYGRVLGKRGQDILIFIIEIDLNQTGDRPTQGTRMGCHRRGNAIYWMLVAIGFGFWKKKNLVQPKWGYGKYAFAIK